MQSMFLAPGNPITGVTPATGTGAIPTKATAGALEYTNPVGGNLGYLYLIQALCTTRGSLILYDRLWHNSGLVGNIITAQSVTSLALTRPDALGAGVEIWLEVYAAMGAVGSVFTVSYTAQDGTAGRSATYTMPANALTVGQMVKFTLQGNDTGVRSIQTVTLSISTTVAGNFGLVLLRPMAAAILNMPDNSDNYKDYAGLGLAQIISDMCIAMMVQCSTTSTGSFLGSYGIGQA